MCSTCAHKEVCSQLAEYERLSEECTRLVEESPYSTFMFQLDCQHYMSMPRTGLPTDGDYPRTKYSKKSGVSRL